MMSACVTMEVQKFMRKLHEINPLRRGSMYLALQVKFQVLERLWNFYWTKGEFWSNLSQSKLGILYIFPELFNFLIFFFFFFCFRCQMFHSHFGCEIAVKLTPRLCACCGYMGQFRRLMVQQHLVFFLTQQSSLSYAELEVQTGAASILKRSMSPYAFLKINGF